MIVVFAMHTAQNDHNPVTPLAVTNWRDIRRKFGIKEKNRRGNMYIIGQTGTGKSTLIANMVISDMEQGNGLALIDPHGDLAQTVLRYVPQRRISDVIYFNATDLEYPIAFNPLLQVPRDKRYLIASGLISVFKKIWPEFWGPRMEHILRHSLLTLLDCPESTLLDLPRLLTESDFRREMFHYVTQEAVRRFWTDEFDKYAAWLKSEATAPILNKVGQFLTSIPLRNIVGQSQNTFDLRRVMDEGKILIVNLSKGQIGEDTCALLGAMLVTEIQLAALSRADVEEHKRRPFYLSVDEAQVFITSAVADMLSESRKYGLAVTAANQFSAQLDEGVRSAILGNVGTLIAFRVGVEDADLFAQEFYPVFSRSDLVNIPNHHIYLKLMIDGVSSVPFSATTLPLPQKGCSFVDQIMSMSRAKFANQQRTVDNATIKAKQEPLSPTSKQGSLFRH